MEIFMEVAGRIWNTENSNKNFFFFFFLNFLRCGISEHRLKDITLKKFFLEIKKFFLKSFKKPIFRPTLNSNTPAVNCHFHSIPADFSSLHRHLVKWRWWLLKLELQLLERLLKPDDVEIWARELGAASGTFFVCSTSGSSRRMPFRLSED